MRQIIKSVLKEYTENLSEGSKRVKLHPRTEADLEYLSQVLWTASKKGDDEPPKKGTVMVIDPKGSAVEVPVFYLSEFPAQGGVFPFEKDKPRNLYNLFIVVNPEEALNPSLKSTYHILYHEVQHLMDLNSTEYISDKKEKEYYDPYAIWFFNKVKEKMPSISKGGEPKISNFFDKYGLSGKKVNENIERIKKLL